MCFTDPEWMAMRTAESAADRDGGPDPPDRPEPDPVPDRRPDPTSDDADPSERGGETPAKPPRPVATTA